MRLGNVPYNFAQYSDRLSKCVCLVWGLGSGCTEISREKEREIKKKREREREREIEKKKYEYRN